MSRPRGKAFERGPTPLPFQLVRCRVALLWLEQWSWAGFGGLKFEANGELITPWGHGVWGAPPEAQGGANGKQVALLAEFAGFKHLLRGNLETRPDGHVRLGPSLTSRRCADNDPAQIHLASGQTRDVPVTA